MDQVPDPSNLKTNNQRSRQQARVEEGGSDGAAQETPSPAEEGTVYDTIADDGEKQMESKRYKALEGYEIPTPRVDVYETVN